MRQNIHKRIANSDGEIGTVYLLLAPVKPGCRESTRYRIYCLLTDPIRQQPASIERFFDDRVFLVAAAQKG